MLFTTLEKFSIQNQFSDVDPEKKADEIFTMFVGKPVYSDLKGPLVGGFER